MKAFDEGERRAMFRVDDGGRFGRNFVHRLPGPSPEHDTDDDERDGRREDGGRREGESR